MGSKLTKKKKFRCNCPLYQESKHCCFHECFPLIEDCHELQKLPGHSEDEQNHYWTLSNGHIESVLSAISLFSLDIPSALTQTIFSFLNTNIDGFHMLCHGGITEYIRNGGSVCNKWSKTLQLKYSSMNQMGHPQHFKVGLFGAGGIGKSALIYRFVMDEWVDDLDPTISDSYRKEVVVDGMSFDGKVEFEVFDSAAQEDGCFGYSETDQWLTHCHMICLCFGINQERTLEECEQLFRQIISLRLTPQGKEHYGWKGVMLVGCKMDLMYDEERECSQKESDTMYMNYERALELSSIWNVPFVETSAKQKINVYALFRQSVYEYWLQTQTRSINWIT